MWMLLRRNKRQVDTVTVALHWRLSSPYQQSMMLRGLSDGFGRMRVRVGSAVISEVLTIKGQGQNARNDVNRFVWCRRALVGVEHKSENGVLAPCSCDGPEVKA